MKQDELEEPPKEPLVMQYKGAGKPVPPVIPRQDLTLTADPEVFDQFLSHVALGERRQAKEMLEASHVLGCFSGTVTDSSGRIFEGISALGLALWNLDIDMCKMLLHYLSPYVARQQAIQCKTGGWVAQGEHAGPHLENLMASLEAFRLCSQTFRPPGALENLQTLWEQVIKAQALVPLHVIDEYCQPIRSLALRAQYLGENVPLLRSRTAAVACKGEQSDEEVSILQFTSEEGKTFGNGLCLVRGSEKMALLVDTPQALCERCVDDLNAVRMLYSARLQQREDLIAGLINTKAKIAAPSRLANPKR